MDVENKRKRNKVAQSATRKRKAAKMLWFEQLKGVSRQLVETKPVVEGMVRQPGDPLAAVAQLLEELEGHLDQEPQPKRRLNVVGNIFPVLGGDGHMPPPPPLDIDAAQRLPRITTQDFGMQDSDGL